MNKIWFLMVVASMCLLLWNTPTLILPTMIESAKDAFSLCLELCAVYAVWMGILEIVDKSGLSEKLAKLLRPIIKKLFKTNDIETQKMIAMNMSANILGLGNAATPMGIKAMKKLDNDKGITTPAIMMLIILNSTSIQLLPTTVIGLRANAGSLCPDDIILPTIISTLITCTTGILLAKFCERIFIKIKNKKNIK